MPGCCVYGCSNRSDRDGVHFFHIPKLKTNSCNLTLEISEKRRAAWLKAIARENVPKNGQVCSAHFHSGKPAYFMMQHDPDWAPSLNLHQSATSTASKASARGRFERRLNRQRQPLQHLQLQNHQENVQEDVQENDQENAVLYNSVACQTDLTLEDIISMEKEVLKPRDYTEEKMKDNDHKVKTYTGLPSFALLLSVFNLVSEYMKPKNRNSVLTKFEEFMIVMMRLRLNLIEDDIAYRFHVTQGTISKIINNLLPVISKCLSGFIIWPDRETLRATMPECFRKAFGTSVTVVIDCFEIFIQRPSDLKARAQTWSDYKHHNTVKYLIGITPQGTVCFISRGWGGRSSDKYIVECSGFLDELKPGDVILADRGFSIGESVGMMQVRLVMPAFMNGRSQLSANDVADTREIAHVRIHVERVIGHLRRKFHVLSDILDVTALQPHKLEDLARIDHILVICCALINLCPPIIPMEEPIRD